MKKENKKKIFILGISLVSLFIISFIISSLAESKNNKNMLDMMTYRIGEEREKGLISIIERSILQGFSREIGINNIKRKHFHNLQIFENEGEMSFLVGEEFFIKELSEKQVYDIIEIAINERKYKNE